MKPEDIIQELAEISEPEKPYKRMIGFKERAILLKNFKTYSFNEYVDDFNRIMLNGGEGIKAKLYIEPQDLLLLN